MRVETEAIALWKKLPEGEGEGGGGVDSAYWVKTGRAYSQCCKQPHSKNLLRIFFRYAYVRVDNFKQ